MNKDFIEDIENQQLSKLWHDIHLIRTTRYKIEYYFTSIGGWRNLQINKIVK